MYKESNTIELKEKLIDEVKEQIVAFLNTIDGTIYIGIKDDGTIIPIIDSKERDMLDLKVGNWIQEAFYPQPSGLITHFFNNDNILVIEIKKGNQRPYYIKERGPRPSGVYKRIGSSIRKASDSEILLMIMETKKYSFEFDVSNEQKLTFSYFNELCKIHNINNDIRSSTSLGMINKNNEYTNLGLLMSDQSPLIVKLAKYDQFLNFKVKKEFKGPLLKVLDQVLENVDNYNDVSAIIDGKSWKRMETISYPGASLRESILNAFAHADYFISSDIKIEFFVDKVKITNPGGIYDATFEQILSGVQTRRNPGLINILYKLNYIENFGTGIPRIINAYKRKNKKPIFNPSEYYFIVELPNLNYIDLVNDPVNDPVNNLEYIIELIRNNPGINTTKIHNILKKEGSKASIDIIKNALKRRLNEFIEFRGPFKTGGYYIKEEYKKSNNAIITNNNNSHIKDLVNDPVNDPVNSYDDISFNLDLKILTIIKNNPGITISMIYKILSGDNCSITLDIIKNTIKRKMDYC